MIFLAIMTAWLSGAPADGFATARKLFDRGRYNEAMAMFVELEKTATPEKQLEAQKLHAFCLFMTDKKDEAKRVWLDLLSKKPDYKLNGNVDSPLFVDYFGRLRPEPRPDAKPEPPQEPAREHTVVPDAPKVDSTAAPATVIVPTPKPRGCGIGLCLIPFGGGQFANNQPAKGALLLVLESGLLATNIAMQLKRDADYRNIATFDEAQDVRLVVVQNVALGLLVGTLVYGLIDAFLLP